MDKSPEKEEADEDSLEVEKLDEMNPDHKFCFCMPHIWGVHVVGASIVATIFGSCVQAYFLGNNDWFGEELYYVILLLLLPIFISLMFYFLFWCGCDRSWH